MVLLIDTDGGEDDLLGIAVALNGQDVKGITTVSGSFPVQYATGNVMGLLKLLEADAPVHSGASKPMSRPLVTCEDLHPSLRGRFPPYAGQSDAVAHISDFLHAYREDTIVCLGPLTNIALAIEKNGPIENPLVVSGGGFDYRNWPPHLPREQRIAEYNMFVDPEAAKIVFDTSQHILLIPADITHNVRWREYGLKVENKGRMGDFLRELYQNHSSPLYDPVAMAVAIRPEIGEYEVTRVDIDCQMYRGNTTKRAGSNVRLCTKVDVNAFFKMFSSLLSR